LHARVHLFYGDDRNEPPRTLGRAIHGLDPGYPHGYKLLPQGRPISQCQGHMRIGHRPSHRGKPEDGVIPMGDAVDLDKTSWRTPDP